MFVPLQPDDPLYVEGSATNFMVLTRATNLPGADGQLGTADDVHEQTNLTTPFVDQNQTYSSHPSHQVFLREYALDGSGLPVATGRLIEGSEGGLATWADVKAQARELLGIDLTDADVSNVPLLATDAVWPVPARTEGLCPGRHGRARMESPGRPTTRSSKATRPIPISHCGRRPHRARLPRRHRA